MNFKVFQCPEKKWATNLLSLIIPAFNKLQYFIYRIFVILDDLAECTCKQSKHTFWPLWNCLYGEASLSASLNEIVRGKRVNRRTFPAFIWAKGLARALSEVSLERDKSGQAV